MQMRRAIALACVGIALIAHGCTNDTVPPSADAGPRNDAAPDDARDAAAVDDGCSGSFACFCGDAICVNGEWTCGPCT